MRFARAGYAASCFGAGCLVLAGCGGGPDTPGDTATPDAAVVVWTGDGEAPLAPAFAAYTKESGIPIDVRGGETPPARADLLVTTDIGALSRLAGESGLRPAYSEVLDANVPATLRHPDSMWFGLFWRPVAIVYDRRAVDDAELSDYAALAAEAWRGKLCLGSSAIAGNRLLLASLIAQLGERPAERIARGWIANLAERPFASEDELLAAIEVGRCAVGIAAGNAVIEQRAQNPDAPLGAYVPSLEAGGVIALVTAAGVTRHATNPAGATALLEWLSTEAAQEAVSRAAIALPANPRVKRSSALRALGTIGNAFGSAQATDRLQAAARLAERASYP